MPERILGEKITKKTIDLINNYFAGSIVSSKNIKKNKVFCPSPIKNTDLLSIDLQSNIKGDEISIVNLSGKQTLFTDYKQISNQLMFYIPLNAIGFYVIKLSQADKISSFTLFVEP